MDKSAMSEPWLDYQDDGEKPWEAFAKQAPKESTQSLFDKARQGDQSARDAYNLRAQTYGQNTLEQDQEQNSPVAGQNFAQNAWQGVGRFFPNLARNFDSPESVDEQRRIDAPLLDTWGGKAGVVGSNVAAYAGPQSAATRSMGAVGAVAPYLSGIATGATQGALEPVGTGESRIDNTMHGAAWGGAGQLAGDVVSAGGAKFAQALTPAQNELWNAAKQMGITLHPSQLTDSKWIKALASQSKYWPGSGFAKQQTRQQLDFNKAVGATLGESTDKIDDVAMAGVKAKQKALYDKAFDGVQIKVDQSALNGFQALQSSLSKRLSADQARQFQAVSDDIGKNIKGGKIEGKVYQELRKELKALEAQNPNGFGAAIKDLRSIVEGTAKRSVPKANQDALAAADRLTRNAKVVEKARNRVTNANGDIAPTSLWSPAHTKYGATPEMKQLSTLGQLIKDPIADSGTAARLDTMGLYGLFTAAPKAVAGRAVNSPALSRYLVNQPKAIEGISRTVGKALPKVTVPMLMASKAAAEDEKKKKAKRL